MWPFRKKTGQVFFDVGRCGVRVVLKDNPDGTHDEVTYTFEGYRAMTFRSALMYSVSAEQLAFKFINGTNVIGVCGKFVPRERVAHYEIVDKRELLVDDYGNEPTSC
jgi:hypothetical protein